MNLHSLGLALVCAGAAWGLSHFQRSVEAAPTTGVALLSPPTQQQGTLVRVTGEATKVERRLSGQTIIRLHADDGADLTAVLNPNPFASGYDHAKSGDRLALLGFHIGPGFLSLDTKQPLEVLPHLTKRVDLYGTTLRLTRTTRSVRGALIQLPNGSVVRIAFPLHTAHLALKVRTRVWTHVRGTYDPNDQRTLLVEELEQR